MGTHKLVNPDGSRYLTDADKRLEDVSKKADDLIHRILNITNQLDICVIRVNQLEQRLDDAKKYWRQLLTEQRSRDE